jgi:ankyrin repeat protein
MKAAIDRAKGANVNDRDSEGNETVLMWAAQFNKNPEVTATLVKAGAIVEVRDYNKNWTTPSLPPRPPRTPK